MAHSTSNSLTAPESSRSSGSSSRFATMQLPSVSSRLLAFALLLLSLSMLVYAAPAALTGPAAKDLAARTDDNVVELLVKLHADILVKLGLLDEHYHHGTDPAGVITDIAALINAKVALILALPADPLGGILSAAKVAKLLVDIVVAIAVHLGKWSDKPNWDIFLTLIVVIDVALKGLLSAVGGLLAAILGLVASLLGAVNVALLVKLKFFLTLGVLNL
ncbi:hypothetical protein FRC07_004408 [Ceratobasidium sp. 392]|nr:hypothetical protein FRC07_004408 [Ceratobasidium sp. 392]